MHRSSGALVANRVLLRSPNVLATPHNAYDTEDAVRRTIRTTLDNIEARPSRAARP
jgi:D-lactate dehydrogenase